MQEVIRNIKKCIIQEKMCMTSIIYIKNIRNNKYMLKFHTPVKFYIKSIFISKGIFFLCIKIKTTLSIECCNCFNLFLKKIQSSSNVKIFLKNKKEFSKKKEYFRKKILQGAFNIIKEEIFYFLPHLGKHNYHNCNNYSTK